MPIVRPALPCANGYAAPRRFAPRGRHHYSNVWLAVASTATTVAVAAGQSAPTIVDSARRLPCTKRVVAIPAPLPRVTQRLFLLLGEETVETTVCFARLVQRVLLSVSMSAHSTRTPPVGSGQMSLALVALASEVQARVLDAPAPTTFISDHRNPAIEDDRNTAIANAISVRSRLLCVSCTGGKEQHCSDKTSSITSHYSSKFSHFSSSFLLPPRRPALERSLGTSPKSTRPLGGRSRSAVQQSVGAGCLFAGTPLIQTRHIPGGGCTARGTTASRRS
jgi:hypothetical protein